MNIIYILYIFTRFMSSETIIRLIDRFRVNPTKMFIRDWHVWQWLMLSTIRKPVLFLT
jgi:hypothetical protein